MLIKEQKCVGGKRLDRNQGLRGVVILNQEEQSDEKHPGHQCNFAHRRVFFVQIADAAKRYSYLLGQTELFKHFVDIKVRRVFTFSIPLNAFSSARQGS